jgi:hypothetical protein
MPAHAEVRPHSDGDALDPSSKPPKRLGRRRVHGEIVPDPIKGTDHVDGVDAEAGRIAADDGRIDGNPVSYDHCTPGQPPPVFGSNGVRWGPVA